MDIFLIYTTSIRIRWIVNTKHILVKINNLKIQLSPILLFLNFQIILSKIIEVRERR